MKRKAGALVLLTALGGCVSMDNGPTAGSGGGGWGSCRTTSSAPPTVPGFSGPMGQPIAMAFPYSAAPPGEEAARAMLARSVPLELMQTGAQGMPGGSSGIIRAGGPMPTNVGMISPAGVPFQPIAPGAGGPGGPGGGMGGGAGGGYPPGAVAAVGALTGAAPSRFTAKRTEVIFAAPQNMKVSWFAPTPDGRAGFAANKIDAPGRYNFVQGAIYRLKLSDLPNRPGVELYPTLEVVPSNPKTDSFLAHSAVPVSFTNEDLDQVAAGNYLVKVIYLPEPQYQDVATTGPDELVSTRLDPGVNPIDEALRRGNILMVVRLGNIDLELANSPAMDTPPPGGGMPGMPGMPGMSCPPGMSMMPGMQGPMPGMPNLMPPANGANLPRPQMLPPAASTPLPTPAAAPQGPVSKLSEASTLERVQYLPTPATTTTTTTTEKKVSRNWWQPGTDK